MLNKVSLFPTYRVWHLRHSIRYMMFLLLHVVLWNILKSLLVWVDLNEVVDAICLQQRFLVLVKQGRHFPCFKSFFFKTLLFLMVVWPMKSRRFLFRRYTNFGFCSKDFLRSSLIWWRFQCLSKAFWILGRVLL